MPIEETDEQRAAFAAAWLEAHRKILDEVEGQCIEHGEGLRHRLSEQMGANQHSVHLLISTDLTK